MQYVYYHIWCNMDSGPETLTPLLRHCFLKRPVLSFSSRAYFPDVSSREPRPRLQGYPAVSRQMSEESHGRGPLSSLPSPLLFTLSVLP